MSAPRHSPGFCGQIACLLDILTPKAGNVSLNESFADASANDFLISAAAITPTLEAAPDRPLGDTILEAIQRTTAVSRSNTNLGIVLLLAPLAKVFYTREPRVALGTVLESSTIEDSDRVYEAIRLAQPGGLGSVTEEDVSAPPTRPLVETMTLAANRDRIAFQYAHTFEDVFDFGLESLREAFRDNLSRNDAVALCHLRFMAHFPDSLIARKCGNDVARESSERARKLLDAGWPHVPSARQGFQAFDRWLRSDGNRRNPGTSADLTVSSLFLAIRDGIIGLPELS